VPRTARASVGEICYHVINRGNARQQVFQKQAFVELIGLACEHIAMRVLAYCVMPNHFHLGLWPYWDGDLGRWMQWLLTSHVRRRYHRHYGSSGHCGRGDLRLSRFSKTSICSRVAPLRPGLVEQAERWPWSSLGRGQNSQDNNIVCQWPWQSLRIGFGG